MLATQHAAGHTQEPVTGTACNRQTVPRAPQIQFMIYYCLVLENGKI